MFTEPILLAFGITVYFILIAFIGYLSRRNIKDDTGYFLASRSLGLWASTSTIAATVIGGSATILVIGQVFARGLPFIWTDLAGGAGLIILGYFLADKVRKTGCFSLPEIAGTMYGPVVRLLAAILVLMAEIGFLAILLRASMALMQPFLNLPPQVTLLIISGVFIFYTIVGGQLAVARTDMLQLILMLIGIFLLTAPILIVSAQWQKVPAQQWNFPFSSEFQPIGLISLILITGLPHLVGSDIYSKILSAKNEVVARQSAILAGLIKIMSGVVVGFIGLAAVTLLPQSTPSEQVLANLFIYVLPAPIAIVVVVSFLATLMSSADSVLLTAATVFTRDLLGVSGKAGVRIGRTVTAGIGIASIMLTLLFDSLLGIFLFSYTLFSVSLVPPILLGFWRDRLKITRSGAIAAMVTGALVVLIAQIAGLVPDLVMLAGLVSSCILLFAISLISRKKVQRMHK